MRDLHHKQLWLNKIHNQMKKINHYTQCFIGKKLNIVNATTSSLEGLSGNIVDETKNIFVIETKSGIKKIMKSNIEFTINDSKEIIDGKLIMKKPEDRLKIKI